MDRGLVVHLLKANGADHAPFADVTLCGRPAGGISAIWPGDGLRGFSWGKPYRINGRYCKTCRAAERTKR